MATITDYLDLVTLGETKTYLRLDDDITELDSEITMMINSACELVEGYTQVYLKPQSKTYYINTEGCARVYAYPITAITSPATATDYEVEVKQLYSIYTPVLTTTTSITASIGYSDTDSVKGVFKMAILETVKLWFYGSESETVMKGYIPNSVMAILASERRFVF